jgi:SSS family solute:Na+ symporter
MEALAKPAYGYMIVAYLAVLIAVGGYFGRKVRDSKDDFLLAGRRLPLFVLVGTLLATWFGGGTVVGGANFVYTRGPWAGVLFFIGAPLGVLILIWLAPKIRGMAKYTVPEILEISYGPKTRLLSTICIFLAYTGIVSYNYTGAAYIVNIVTGFDQRMSVIIAAFIMIFLACTAGMYSVAWTDALSALLIFAGMGGGFYFAISNAGGYASAYASLSADQQSLSGGLNMIQLLGYVAPLFFLYIGDQNQIQRYSCAKNPKEARKSALLLFCGMLLVMFLVISYCVFASKLLKDIPGDTAIMRMAVLHMPFIFGALILCACVAFLVTTGDSFLLSAATNIMLDVVQKYFKPNMTDKELVFGTRVAIILIGLFSYVMAAFLPEVLAMQMYSYSIYGAGVTIPFLGALLWKKASPAGGMMSVIVGAAAILAWDMYLKRPHGVNGIIIAVPAAVIALVVFSLAFPKNKTIEAK